MLEAIIGGFVGAAAFALLIMLCIENARAWAEVDRLRAVLESLTKDPPATFAREPDTDCEVIIIDARDSPRSAQHP